MPSKFPPANFLSTVLASTVLFLSPMAEGALKCSEIFRSSSDGFFSEIPPTLSQIGSPHWAKLMYRILQKLGRNSRQTFTSNDQIVLASIGVSSDLLQQKNWNDSRQLIYDTINRSAEANAQVRSAVEAYQKQTLGSLVALSPIQRPQPIPGSRAESAYHRMDTGFGVLLLPPNDKAYQDHDYLAKTIGNRGATSTGYTRHDPQKSFDFFQQQFKRWSDGQDHEVVPVAFTQGASDAAGLLVDVSNWIVSLRNQKRMNGRILVFDESYVAARGPLRHLRFFDRSDTGAQRFESQTLWKNEVVGYRATKGSIKEDSLTELDQQALTWIEEQFKKKDVGIFIVEPIATSAFVQFHRPAVLRALSALAKKYGVAIVADEAFGGGGRTGRPFSYNYYAGFVPDFVIFGKGMVTAGLAEVARTNGENPFLIQTLESQIENQRDLYQLSIGGPVFKLFDPTITGWSDIFLKSAVTIKRVLDDRLMDNAVQMGAKLKREVEWLVHIFCYLNSGGRALLNSRLSTIEKENIFRNAVAKSPNSVRSLGLIIGLETNIGNIRLTPPITFSDQELRDFTKQVILDTLIQADNKIFNGTHFQEIDYLRNLGGEALKQQALEIRFKYFDDQFLLPNIVGDL